MIAAIANANAGYNVIAPLIPVKVSLVGAVFPT